MTTAMIVLFALTVELPSVNSEGVVTLSDGEVTDTTYSGSNYIFSVVFDFINKHIWYAFWVIAFALLLYAGYLLVTSEWESQWLKKANKTLVYGLVGLLIAILSYAIVMFIVNLF